jgi:hypothetical protein
MDRLDTLQLSINPLESALSIGYQVPGLIGQLILPVYRVGSRTVRTPLYGMESFRLTDARRALRSEPKEIDFTVSYQDAVLEEYALQVPVDRRETEASATVGVDHISRARTTAQRNVAINREKDIAALLTATGSYASGNSETVSSGSGWNELTSGVSNVDPVQVVDAKKEIVRGKIGMEPNAILMGQATWNAFKFNTNVVAKIPGGTGADQTAKRVTEVTARELLEVDHLYIGKGVYSDDGSAFTDIWGDVCIMAYINPNPTEVEEPTFGFTLARQYGEVEGLPLLGLAGEWEKNPWVTGVWYQEERKAWIALNTAGYLMLDCVK